MKNITRKITTAIATVMMMFIAMGMAAMPVFAEDPPEGSEGGDGGCVDTAVLGEGGQYCEDRDGGVKGLIMNVVDIMSVGVGILGVIGITVVGLQYLTAGGSEEKVRTAKRRMFEIVIGLVAYVLIYAILKWLLPGFS